MHGGPYLVVSPLWPGFELWVTVCEFIGKKNNSTVPLSTQVYLNWVLHVHVVIVMHEGNPVMEASYMYLAEVENILLVMLQKPTR